MPLKKFQTSQRFGDIEDYWDEQDKSRKSIPKAEIEQLGYKLNYSISPRIPFLKGVDLLIANS